MDRVPEEQCHTISNVDNEMPNMHCVDGLEEKYVDMPYEHCRRC